MPKRLSLLIAISFARIYNITACNNLNKGHQKTAVSETIQKETDKNKNQTNGL